METHAPVEGYILVGQALRLGQQSVAHVVGRLQRLVGSRAQLAANGPGEIDGRRPGRFQHSGGLFQIAQQCQPVGGATLAGGQGHGERRCRANGRRAAHNHVADGVGDGLIRVVLRHNRFKRQQALIDHSHDVPIILPKDLSLIHI